MKGWQKAILLLFRNTIHFPSSLGEGARRADEVDENVRVGFGMDPDDKLNKANCLQPRQRNYEVQITNHE